MVLQLVSYKMLSDFSFIFMLRYVDMIANPEVADVFRIRAKVIKPILFCFLKVFDVFNFVLVNVIEQLNSNIALCF